MTGPRTALHVLAMRPEWPSSIGSDGVSRRRAWRLIEELRHMGAIAEGSYRRGNRHATSTLIATTEGSANAPNG